MAFGDVAGVISGRGPAQQVVLEVFALCGEQVLSLQVHDYLEVFETLAGCYPASPPAVTFYKRSLSQKK